MKPISFMIIAGEASGDGLAAELVAGLREEFTRPPAIPTDDYQPLTGTFQPRFFGAGGTHMAAAGVELAIDLTAHAVVGFSDVVRDYLKFRRIFRQLFRLAIQRQPDAVICVDFSGFNRRFAHAVRRYTRRRQDWFHTWNPRIVQYVSPQVWASREQRVYQMARDYDLLLSIFPFEPAWYAQRVPSFKVEFVGHPLAERYPPIVPDSSPAGPPRSVVLLPGSRRAELKYHMPILNAATQKIREALPDLKFVMVAPTDSVAALARQAGIAPGIDLVTGDLARALATADLAIASTGTVTLECAFCGIPTIALYKTTFLNYFIAKQIATVQYLAMPNLLAGEQITPEFIQSAATPDNIASAAVELLRDPQKRQHIRQRLAEVVQTLRIPGTRHRAAQAIARLFSQNPGQ